MFGCGESGPLEDGAELSAILGKVDGFGLGAEHRHTCGLELVGQAQRGLAAEGAHDAEDLAGGELGMVDLHDVFERQRFEVQPIGGVVVGRHGLRVAVDHNRLESGRADRHGGVDARVVELDALTDPVRSGAEDDHGRAVARHDLGLGVVGRVVVRGLGFEFAGAGVDGLEHRAHAQGVADAGDDTGVEDAQGRDLLIGEAVVLRDPQDLLIEFVGVADIGGHLIDELDLVEVPGVDLAGVEDLFRAQSGGESPLDRMDAVSGGVRDGFEDGFADVVV